jgi:hypothetical protein
LSLVVLAILATWIVLYAWTNPDTRWGQFFGNAVADWCGTLVLVVGTKFLFETGSAESRRIPERLRQHFLVRHSLTIFLLVSGVILYFVYRSRDPAGKWTPVLGNVLSEWLQAIGIVVLTKRLLERHSKESR